MLRGSKEGNGGKEKMVLFSEQPGLKLRLEGRHLLCELSDHGMKIPLREVSALAVGGRISCSSSLLIRCMEQEIPVLFLSGQGGICGWIHPKGKGCHIRKLQYHVLMQERKQRLAACWLVREKIVAQRLQLRHFRSNRVLPELSEAIRKLTDSLRKIRTVSTLPELRGVEGYASKVYWSAWQHMLPDFRGRRAHPAEDVINSMLSFGYMLLANELAVVASARGLDLDLPILHAESCRYSPLPWDLVEVCRAKWVDRIVLAGFRRRRYRMEEFETETDGTIRLGREVKKKFLADFYGAFSEDGWDGRLIRKPLERLVDGFIEKLKEVDCADDSGRL